MLKVEFTHAEVEDSGWGLKVNGESLEGIISKALGTKMEGASYDDPRLKRFKANSCDVLVVITPHATTTHIETKEDVWRSVAEMEEDLSGKLSEETTAAES